MDGSTIFGLEIPEYILAQVADEAAMYPAAASGAICEPCEGAGSFKDKDPDYDDDTPATYTRCDFCHGRGLI